YCLHLPRNGMDVIYSPDWLFTKGDVMHQHNIFIIPSKLNEKIKNLLEDNKPTLYICEPSCYEEVIQINAKNPSDLGCATFEDLSSSLLS
ncbi:hypothetical protein R0J90_17005, partial [Micrococcus sp. SIMBA_144]